MTNRFKGLDLVDKVPEELWTEICSPVHEAVTKLIPKRKKCKKAKWLSEKALQIADERRKAKGKGERERYTWLSAESQRIARRDKRPSSMNSLSKGVSERHLIDSIEDAKTFDHKPCWRSQQTVENSQRDGNTRPPYLSSEKPVWESRSNS